MAEIENLSISVTTSVDSAVKAFDKLAASADKVKSAAKRAAGGVDEMASAAKDAGIETKTAGEESESAASKLRSFGRSAEDSGKAAKRGTSGITSFWQSLKRIAYYRFIRTVLKEIGQAFKEGVSNLYQWSSAVDGHFAASMDRLATSSQYLKNSLGAMASPLIESVIPVLDVIIDKVVDVLNFFNMLVAAVSGADTYTVAKKAAAVWDESATKTANSAKSAANELKRTLLGFDEINKLVKQTSYSGGGGGSSGKTTPNYGVMFEEKPLTGGFMGFSNAIENALQDTLSRLGLIVSGATLAVGAILTFSGANVPLGLAMMAAGASGLVSVIAMNWDGLSADVKLAIGAVELAAGGSLLALGAIMAFSGVNAPLGIAMMAAGAIGITSAVGLNWGFLTGEVSASTEGIITALSLGSMAVGAILAFSGISPSIGIALMAAGITGAAIVPNWGFIAEKLKGPIGDVTLLVSTASLMLGMVAMAGGRIPLGVGLLIAGSMGLAMTIAARWDRLKHYLEGPIGEITGLLGAASLVLGFVAIAGGRIPLGLGLIIAGSAGLAGTIAARWDRLNGYLEGPVGDLTAMLSGASLILGFAAIAAGRIPLGLGLMVLGSAGLAATIAARWDRLNSYIEGPLGALTTAISGALLVLGFAAISAGRIPLGLGLMVTGSAGLAVTLAARWNRLQEYIEGPIGTITTLISGASLMLGFVALAAGRIPLGVGLLTLGATGLATTLPALWDRLKKHIEGPIGEIVGIISAATLLLGIVAFATGNIGLGLGLMLLGSAGLASTIAANWDNIKELGSAAIAKVKEGWDNANLYFEIKIKPVLANVKEVFSNVGEKSKNMLEGLSKPGGVTGFLGNLLGALGGKSEDLNVDLTVNAVPGVGMSRKQAYGSSGLELAEVKANPIVVEATATAPWLRLGVPAIQWLQMNDLSTIVNATATAPWLRSLVPAIQWLQMSDLKTTVNATATAPWLEKRISAIKWLQLDNLTTTVKVNTSFTGSGTMTPQLRAKGGVFNGGKWSDIPQYAGGTTNARGSLFLAGEAGPEIVGHVGGRTEVLNKSQLAATMYAAVQAAMAPASANFANAAAYMSSYSGNEYDDEHLEDMIFAAVERAMARSNDLDRQRNEYLRQINDKDFSNEWSTSGLSKAQMRTNRRAGRTIIPVGT